MLVRKLGFLWCVLWIKMDGRRIRNGIRDLIADLDAIPFPDRALYATL